MNNIDRENGFAFLKLSRNAENNNNNNSQREFRSVDRNLLDLIESLEIPTNQMIIQRLLLLILGEEHYTEKWFKILIVMGKKLLSLRRRKEKNYLEVTIKRVN